MDEHDGIVHFFAVVEGLLHRLEVGHSPSLITGRVLLVLFLVASTHVDAFVKLFEGFLPGVGEIRFLRNDEIEADRRQVARRRQRRAGGTLRRTASTAAAESCQE